MTGADFRAALTDLGLSQRAFAARFSLHEVVVSRWVNGVHAVPPWVPGVLALLRERTVTVITPRPPRRRPGMPLR